MSDFDFDSDSDSDSNHINLSTNSSTNSSTNPSSTSTSASGFTNYYGTHQDSSGHYQPSVPSSSIPTLTHFQPNVYGYYTHANGLIPFDNIKGLPLTYFHSYGQYQYNQLEHSNKILLPSTVLTAISQYDNIVYPLIFQVDGTFDLLGVAEFVDEIDIAYLPNRIFQKILASNGLQHVDQPISIGLKLHNQDIARGTQATLRAHDAKFIEIDDHQTYLQLQLQQYYSILQEGQVLEFPPPESLGYPSGEFLKVDVMKTKPEKEILITETNLAIDFEEPLNYQEYLLKKKEEHDRKIEAERKALMDQVAEKQYERMRKFIPEYGPTFWEDREKKSLEETGLMPPPSITLPNGQTIFRLRFPRGKSKEEIEKQKDEKDKSEKDKSEKEAASQFKPFQGTGNRLGNV